jgi:hypothetical protein
MSTGWRIAAVHSTEIRPRGTTSCAVRVQHFSLALPHDGVSAMPALHDAAMGEPQRPFRGHLVPGNVLVPREKRQADVKGVVECGVKHISSARERGPAAGDRAASA